MELNDSKVEKAFFEEAGLKKVSTRIPYITVESFPKLGLLSALSFIEWANKNPEGVVSLPTGKTAQYFLQFIHLILDNWESEKTKKNIEQVRTGRYRKT